MYLFKTFMDSPVSFIDFENRDAHLLDAYSQTITGIAGMTSQSVVHIQVDKQVRDRRTNKQTLVPASGSGFVISSDGYIVTNHHVIEDAEKIAVMFSDGHVLQAELRGADPSTDIAVLKIYDI